MVEALYGLVVRTLRQFVNVSRKIWEVMKSL